MRVVLGLAIWIAGIAVSGQATAQYVTELDAINRCDAFVEESLRPEIGTQFKSTYKIVCYFGMIDPEIHLATKSVCDRAASALGSAHRVIASFACQGTYEIYSRDIAAAQ